MPIDSVPALLDALRRYGLLEPGQLSAQSLQQIKTVHSMSLRINEIMQRFSSLASEIRDAETTSQPETEDIPEDLPTRA